MTADKAELTRRMEGALASLHQEFGGLRAGRASTSLLEHITVDAYGSQMPLNQVGNVTVPEPRMLAVKVWDKGLVKAVEKAITNANLGVNPIADGDLVRIPLPDLSEERRKELVKIASRYAEQARIAVRNVRRDGMDSLKKMEKDKEISEDEHKNRADDIQKLTDEYVKKIDEALTVKEKDILGN